MNCAILQNQPILFYSNQPYSVIQSFPAMITLATMLAAMIAASLSVSETPPYKYEIVK